MHARKIALHKYSIIAIVMTLLVIGSALALAGNSTAISPQVGKVSYTASYYLGGTYFAPANSTTTVVKVSTLNGVYLASDTGATGNFSLPYGSYILSVSPSVVRSGSTSLITNGTSYLVNVTSSSQLVSLNLPSYKTVSTAVRVLPSSTSTISFVTPDGYTFYTKSVTNSSTFYVNLPTGKFYYKVSSGGEIYSSYVASVATPYLNITLTGSVSGFVTSNSGNFIQNFNIVNINPSLKTYTVIPFTDGVFNINSTTTSGHVFVITANGYASHEIPASFTSGSTIQLTPASNNITYNYTLGSNPKYLNLSVNYDLTNSTTIPFLGNSSVGSLYYQYIFDNLGTTGNTTLATMLTNMFGQYTNNSIFVAGYNYQQVGYGSIVSSKLSQAEMLYTVKFEFQNPDIQASDVTSGFQVKLYVDGTQYMPGTLYNNYVFAYSVPGVSLASPATAAKTFVSPVELLPQSSSGFMTLSFTKTSAPRIIASEINLYWSNMASHNYLVTSNTTSAVFLAPIGVPVYFNISNAYFNPVTGTNDYLKSINYVWTVNGSSSVQGSNLYNFSNTFNGFGNYTLTVNVTSSTDSSNQTTFNVYAFDGTPTASLNVSSEGKTIFPTQTVGTSQSLSVPQSKTVQFSGYGSSLPIPGSGYKAPLTYNWYFPGFTNSAMNVTQVFNTPWIQSKTFVTGYLNVTTAVGKVASVLLSLNVTDTTPPSPQMTLYNSTQAAISQPIAGQLTIFSANKTTDKYYPASDLKYSWKIVYANGTQVPAGSSTYEQVGNNTNLSYFKVNFNTLNSLIVSLKVTNPSNVSAYSNFTTSIVVNSPRLIVQSVYFPTTPAQGSKTLVYVNVSNNGTVNANSFAIVVLVNGKNVSYQTYGALPVGATKQFEFNLTSPSSGNVQFVFEAVNDSEPSFFATAGSLSVTHSVNPPAYQTPLIIGIVIAVIVLIGVAYYRLSARGPSKPRESKLAPKKPEEKKK